jgi:hypothetical protein
MVRAAAFSFDFCEELFDRIEVGTVGGQISQLGACSFNGLSDAGHLVAGEIVHHDDVALLQRWDDGLLDIGKEAFAVDRAVEHTRCGDFVGAQSRHECYRFPMAPGHVGHEALAARATAITSRHIGRRTGFVDEDQAFRVQVGLAGMPRMASRGDIWPLLFGSVL